MKLYALPENLRNSLIAYLVSRPYAEVANGVRELEALAALPEVPSAKPDLAPAPDAEKEK